MAQHIERMDPGVPEDVRRTMILAEDPARRCYDAWLPTVAHDAERLRAVIREQQPELVQALAANPIEALLDLCDWGRTATQDPSYDALIVNGHLPPFLRPRDRGARAEWLHHCTACLLTETMTAGIEGLSLNFDGGKGISWGPYVGFSDYAVGSMGLARTVLSEHSSMHRTYLFTSPGFDGLLRTIIRNGHPVSTRTSVFEIWPVPSDRDGYNSQIVLTDHIAELIAGREQELVDVIDRHSAMVPETLLEGNTIYCKQKRKDRNPRRILAVFMTDFQRALWDMVDEILTERDGDGSRR